MNPKDFNSWLEQYVDTPEQSNDDVLESLQSAHSALNLTQNQFLSVLGNWLNSSYVSPFMVGQFLQDRRYYMGTDLLRCTDDVSLLHKAGVNSLLVETLSTGEQYTDMELVSHLLGKSPKCFEYVVNSPEFQKMVCERPDIAELLIGPLHTPLYSTFSDAFVESMINHLELKWVRKALGCRDLHPSPLLRKLMQHPVFVKWAHTYEDDLISSYSRFPHTHADLVRPLITKNVQWSKAMYHMAYQSQQCIGTPMIDNPQVWMEQLLEWIRSVSSSEKNIVDVLTHCWLHGNHDAAVVGECVLNSLKDAELTVFIQNLETNPSVKAAMADVEWRHHPRVLYQNIKKALKNNTKKVQSTVRKKM